MRARAVVLAVAIVLAPLGAQAADLVVWWEKGFYPQEDAAVRETIAAFEQKTGKQVELVQSTQDELPGKVKAALEAGQPPDFVFGVLLQDYIGQWAASDQLVDLSEVVGGFSNLFDPDALAWVTWRDPKTGQTRALRAAGRARDQSRPRLEEPVGARGLHARRHPARVGRRSGRSGATEPSRRSARPWAATTSGASHCRCRCRMAIPTSSSSSSWRPTTPATSPGTAS